MRIGPGEILVLMVLLLIIVGVVVAVALATAKRKPVQAGEPPSAPGVIDSEIRFCSRCGKEVVPGAVYCASCGATLRPGVRVGGTYQRSRIAAGLLGIFLGGLGIHRFYLGFTSIGIVQIIVTLITFGIGAIWGFIEGILILTGSFDRDAEGQGLAP